VGVGETEADLFIVHPEIKTAAARTKESMPRTFSILATRAFLCYHSRDSSIFASARLYRNLRSIMYLCSISARRRLAHWTDAVRADQYRNIQLARVQLK